MLFLCLKMLCTVHMYVCVYIYTYICFFSLYLLMHLSLIFFVSYLLPLLNALSGPVRYHEWMNEWIQPRRIHKTCWSGSRLCAATGESEAAPSVRRPCCQWQKRAERCKFMLHRAAGEVTRVFIKQRKQVTLVVNVYCDLYAAKWHVENSIKVHMHQIAMPKANTSSKT